MAYSLFDKLGQHIDISAGSDASAPMHPPNTPAQRTPELEDVEKTKASPNMASMKFAHSLIKHLDELYSKMLAGEVAEIVSEPKNNGKTRVIEGQTSALILEEQESYYNSGNSNVTESF